MGKKKTFVKVFVVFFFFFHPATGTARRRVSNGCATDGRGRKNPDVEEPMEHGRPRGGRGRADRRTDVPADRRRPVAAVAAVDRPPAAGRPRRADDGLRGHRGLPGVRGRQLVVRRAGRGRQPDAGVAGPRRGCRVRVPAVRHHGGPALAMLQTHRHIPGAAERLQALGHQK